MQTRTPMAYSYSTKSLFSTVHTSAEGTLYTTKRYTPYIYKYSSKPRYPEVKSDQKRIVHQDQENNGNKIHGKEGIVHLHHAKDSTKTPKNPKTLSVNTVITQKGKKGYGHKKSFYLNNRPRSSDKVQGEFMLSLLVS